MKRKVETGVLPNGLQIVHCQIPSAVAYSGLTVNVGTRDELVGEHGLAHFLEHLLFKGTKKRKAYHINNRLESVGGELNAYTTKEETVVHAATLSGDFSKAVELIADVAFSSVFPEVELQKEKEVIIDEIDSYLDSPAEAIFDDFEEFIFADSPLGRNILGDKNNIRKLTAQHLQDFVSRHYSPDKMVFSSVGRMSFSKVYKLAERYFAQYPSRSLGQQRVAPPLYRPFNKRQSKGTHQAHCVLGVRSYPISDKRITGLMLLANLLGGPSSNSRLNTSLREKHGLVYNVEASCTPYEDTGLLNIYFGTSKGALDSALSFTLEELQKLRTVRLTELQLGRAKKQLVGQLAIANESWEQLMLSLGKSLLSLERIDTPEETLAKINAVTPGMLIEIANELFDPDSLSTLIYT